MNKLIIAPRVFGIHKLLSIEVFDGAGDLCTIVASIEVLNRSDTAFAGQRARPCTFNVKPSGVIAPIPVTTTRISSAAHNAAAFDALFCCLLIAISYLYKNDIILAVIIIYISVRL